VHVFPSQSPGPESPILLSKNHRQSAVGFFCKIPQQPRVRVIARYSLLEAAAGFSSLGKL